jgi:uncharacterized peroxidase-related enzyme
VRRRRIEPREIRAHGGETEEKMSFIETIGDESAQGDTASLYEEDRSSLGYVANYTRVFSHRPDVMRGWEHLSGAIKSNMDRRRYELATLAAATTLRSSYCSLAHGKVLAANFYSSEEVAAISRDFRAGPLSEAEVALMAFAEKVAAKADEITQSDIDELRDQGFADAEIFDIAAAAAARCFFSKLLDAMGAQPDAAYRDLTPELQSALVVGRPIQD